MQIWYVEPSNAYVAFGSQADILARFARSATTRRLGVDQPPVIQEPGFERLLSPLAVARAASSRPTAVGQCSALIGTAPDIGAFFDRYEEDKLVVRIAVTPCPGLIMIPQVHSKIDRSFHRHEYGNPSGYNFDSTRFGHTSRHHPKIRATRPVIAKRKLHDSPKVLDGEKARRSLF